MKSSCFCEKIFLSLSKQKKIMITKNLENKEILSDDVLFAIDRITKAHPEAVFGGSLALNAVGLLNRKIKDIDVFFHRDTLVSPCLFDSEPSKYPSEQVEEIDETTIAHHGLTIDDIGVCVFMVDDKLLLSTPIEFLGRKINIQNVNYAIMAKLSYESKGYVKHKDDLEKISEKFSLF